MSESVIKYENGGRTKWLEKLKLRRSNAAIKVLVDLRTLEQITKTSLFILFDAFRVRAKVQLVNSVQCIIFVKFDYHL